MLGASPLLKFIKILKKKKRLKFLRLPRTCKDLRFVIGKIDIPMLHPIEMMLAASTCDGREAGLDARNPG